MSEGILNENFKKSSIHKSSEKWSQQIILIHFHKMIFNEPMFTNNVQVRTIYTKIPQQPHCTFHPNHLWE
jgi:hypothetical protein